MPAEVTRIARGNDGDVFLMFWCPGCEKYHGPRIESTLGRSVWAWNGDRERPTLSPSVLVRSGHHVPEHMPGSPCWCTYNAEHPEQPTSFKCYVCHSFVTDGRIQFLSDCTHALAGQTVDLPKAVD